jgi:hypothetical protein
VPLAFIPFAAAAMASPRANRFVESVFTAPVDRRDWFMAKVLVLLTVAAAYYLPQPFGSVCGVCARLSSGPAGRARACIVIAQLQIRRRHRQFRNAQAAVQSASADSIVIFPAF